MNRTIRTGVLALALVAVFPAWVHAGVMLWQVTGMEGIGARYGFANGRSRKLAESSARVESVWSMEGAFHTTAAALMRWEIWNCLKASMDGEEGLPSYRNLVDSGIISVNSIQMPELLGNTEL